MFAHSASFYYFHFSHFSSTNTELLPEKRNTLIHQRSINNINCIRKVEEKLHITLQMHLHWILMAIKWYWLFKNQTKYKIRTKNIIMIPFFFLFPPFHSVFHFRWFILNRTLTYCIRRVLTKYYWWSKGICHCNTHKIKTYHDCKHPMQQSLIGESVHYGGTFNIFGFWIGAKNKSGTEMISIQWYARDAEKQKTRHNMWIIRSGSIEFPVIYFCSGLLSIPRRCKTPQKWLFALANRIIQP